MPSQKTVKSKKTRTILSDEFYSDIEVADMIHAVLIRSPRNSGLVAGIKLPDLGEEYKFFSATDLPGSKTVKVNNTEIPVFCGKRIQYLGEPVGILTGPDEYVLNKLKNKVHVILHDSDEEQMPETPSITKTVSNFQIRQEEFEQIFNKELTISSTWKSKIRIPSFSEPEGALCQIKNSTARISTPTRWFSNLRNAVASTLNFTPDSIAITKTKIQPYSKNGLWRNSIICAQTALAALKTGRPVKLCFSQDEHRKFINSAFPLEISYRTAINSSGKILAMDIKIEADIGAFDPFANEILDRLMIASCGIYNFENFRIQAVAKTSRNPPSVQSIDFIVAQASFALESQMNRISEVTGIMPFELRSANICSTMKNSSMPFFIPIENDVEKHEALTRVCDIKRKFTTYRLDSIERRKKSNMLEQFPLRGIGMASSASCYEYYGSPIQFETPKIEVSMESENSLVIKSMPPSAAILAIWKEKAASILGIKQSEIKVSSNFENNDEPLMPENFYTNISIMTELLKKCCIAIQRKAKKGIFPVTVKKAVPKNVKAQWNAQRLAGIPFGSASFATAAVELELDPCTLRCKLRGIWMVIDAGQLLMENEAKNRIYLEINRALGVFFERQELDCSKISVVFISSQSSPKPIQGLVLNTLPAAFLSALSQAISETITSLPVNHEILFQKYALKNKTLQDKQHQEKTEQETSVYSKTLTLQESPALAKSNDESDDLNHLQQTTQQDLIQNTDSISKCASQNSQEELHK